MNHSTAVAIAGVQPAGRPESWAYAASHGAWEGSGVESRRVGVEWWWVSSSRSAHMLKPIAFVSAYNSKDCYSFHFFSANGLAKKGQFKSIQFCLFQAYQTSMNQIFISRPL